MARRPSPLRLAGPTCRFVLHQGRERRVDDAREGEVVQLPTEVSGAHVGADAEPDSYGLAREGAPQVERLHFTRRERRIATDERTPPAQRVLGPNEQRPPIAGVDPGADVLPGGAAVAADLDHA